MAAYTIEKVMEDGRLWWALVAGNGVRYDLYRSQAQAETALYEVEAEESFAALVEAAVAKLYREGRAVGLTTVQMIRIIRSSIS